MSLGFDEESKEEVTEEKVTDIAEVKKKRLPYQIWTVGKKEYKLKLTTANIIALENKYRRNIMSLVSDDDMPPISLMLTIIQAAMLPYQHDIKAKDVAFMFDSYLDEGGSQIKLFIDVVMPLMAVSGFFTPSQAEKMLENMKEASQEMESVEAEAIELD